MCVKEKDILLEFLKQLVQDKQEQSILELIFENCGEDEIIEKLIDYNPSKLAK